MTTQDSSTYWKRGRVELRAAGFDPDRAAQTNAVVTIASAYTNAHRCNNRVRAITDLLVDILAERGGQGLIVGAPAVSDALTQGTPTAGYSLASRDTVADCFEIGHYAHHGDAMIVISGCDKTGAAALMPLARTNAFGLRCLEINDFVPELPTLHPADRQEVHQSPPGAIAHIIFRLPMLARMMMHRHLADPKPFDLQQYREKPMHAIVELDRPETVSSVSSERTPDIDDVIVQDASAQVVSKLGG